MAIALGRLERRRLPLVERIGRLHVVVVVDEERARAASDLADDRWRSTIDAERGGVQPGATRALENDARSVDDADPLRGNSRLPDQGLELGDVLRHAGTHVGVEGREA